MSGAIELLGDWHARFGRGDEFYGAALLRAQVVAATCLGLQSFKGADVVEFDLCIIDEASKATATESLVPMVQAKRWVLVATSASCLRSSRMPSYGGTFSASTNLASATSERRSSTDCPSPAAEFAGSALHSAPDVPEIGELISECFYDDGLASRRARGQLGSPMSSNGQSSGNDRP